MFFTNTENNMIVSTLLILAVCRTRVIYEHSKWPSSPRVLVVQLVRAPDRYLGDHGFESCRGLFFVHARVIIDHATNLPSIIFITVILFLLHTASELEH